MRYVWRVRNESQTCDKSTACNTTCSWAKNHLIILSISYRKMTNSTENLSERTSEKRPYQVWNKIKKRQFIIWSDRSLDEDVNSIVWRLDDDIASLQIKCATYSRFFFYILSDHYSSAKIAIWINHIIARATDLAVANPHKIKISAKRFDSYIIVYSDNTII